MYCHCGFTNRAPRWIFTDPYKPEVRLGAREESASPAWLAAPAMNACDTTKVYVLRLDNACGPTLYRKCHSHNTPGRRHNNTWVEHNLGYGQQMFEILSRTNMTVKSYCPYTYFGYVYTVTSPLKVWTLVKVMTHPMVMYNNCVKYHPHRTRG